MKFIIATLSFAAVALAAVDDCVEVNAYAAAFAGDCEAVAACFGANVAWANDGFANSGFSNEGFVGNSDGSSNDGFSNEGFVGNSDGSSNDGFSGLPEIGYNAGFELNSGFANDAFISVSCQDLYNCGAFEEGAAFGNCFPTPLPTPEVTGELVICEELFLGDGACDDICNTEEFFFDGGDCDFSE